MLTSLASATDYYVAPWGNNADTGLSLDHTWKTPSYSAQQVGAGDTIYLLDGIWNNEIIDFSMQSGDPSHPIILTAYNGTPVLRNSKITTHADSCCNGYIYISKIKISGKGIYIRNADNVHISNVEVFSTSGVGVHFIDVTNSELVDSDIHDNGWNSVMVQSNYRDTSNILIQNNTIHDNPGNSGGQGHNLIDLFNYGASTEVKNIKVIRNKIYNVTLNFLFEHAEPSSYDRMHNIFIKDNIFYNSSQGTKFDYLTDSIIENNIAYSSSEGFKSNKLHGNTTFINNTIFNTKNENILLLTEYPDEFVLIEDNLVVNNRVGTGKFVVRNPLKKQFTIRASFGGVITVQFTNNTVFTAKGFNISYYSDRSEYITEEDEKISITTYPMTARPASGSATVAVNIFNTSLPKGILVDFTANTIDENKVTFTVSTLTPGKYYLIKKGGKNFTTRQADASGNIKFSNSDWPAGTFTIEKIPGISGDVRNVNQTPLTGINVTLFYQNGTPTGQSTLSGEDGKFYFINVAGGSYYVEVTRKGYESKNSSVFTVTTGTDEDIGAVSVVRFDINGDGDVNILDMNTIGQHFGENSGQPSPEYDVNGDGVVDQKDYLIVAMHAMELILTRIDL